MPEKLSELSRQFISALRFFVSRLETRDPRLATSFVQIRGQKNELTIFKLPAGDLIILCIFAGILNNAMS